MVGFAKSLREGKDVFFVLIARDSMELAEQLIRHAIAGRTVEIEARHGYLLIRRNGKQLELRANELYAMGAEASARALTEFLDAVMRGEQSVLIEMWRIESCSDSMGALSSVTPPKKSANC